MKTKKIGEETTKPKEKQKKRRKNKENRIRNTHGVHEQALKNEPPQYCSGERKPSSEAEGTLAIWKI